MDNTQNTYKTESLHNLISALRRNHWEAHKLLHPGEYGLGDNMSDKETFVRLSNLWEQDNEIHQELESRSK